MVDPTDVFHRVMGHLFAGDAGAYADMFAEDAVVEWPFAPAGWPKRLDGRDAIRTHVGAMLARFQGSGRNFVAVRNPVAHPIGTHELAVEFSFEITTPQGPMRRPYVHFLRVMDDGKIAALRDYFVPASVDARRTA
jgi:ketosteroid isomerase-like protein